MSKYAQKIASQMAGIILLLLVAFINWGWPLYMWFGDTPVMRFIWLGIFFIILDIIIEIITRFFKELRLMAETVGFNKEIRKVSKGFHVISKFILPNNLKADHVVVGSSGVWLVIIKDDWGKITFNGDQILQDGVVLSGAITLALEMAYGLTNYLKEKLGREIKVAPVIAFSSLRVDLAEMPKTVRGVFISSRKDIVSLTENTDFQILDQKTIEEIYNILKK